MNLREKLRIMAEIERRNRAKIETFFKARERPCRSLQKKTRANSPGACKP